MEAINSKLTPKKVFLISLIGFLPVIALFLIAGRKAGDMVLDPPKHYERVKSLGFTGKILLTVGNIGDAIGYYLIILPFVVVFTRRNDAPLVRNGGRLLFAYAINGIFWALLGAFALPWAVSRGYRIWELIMLMCQTVGLGFVGNTLGSTGWMLLGAGLWQKYRDFSLFSISLGVMYFLGGTVSSIFVPGVVELAGIAYYLFMQLLIWNPWMAKITQEIESR
jgi:hypothetical protein